MTSLKSAVRTVDTYITARNNARNNALNVSADCVNALSVEIYQDQHSGHFLTTLDPRVPAAALDAAGGPGCVCTMKVQ